MERPLVTVIIPVYNAEKTLRKCLGRVKNQSYDRLEVLLVDDGSTDGSQAICEEYCRKDPRFRLLCQPHQGVAVGRNRAIAEAKGTYLQFIGGMPCFFVDGCFQYRSDPHFHLVEGFQCNHGRCSLFADFDYHTIISLEFIVSTRIFGGTSL